jgi:hypothetical protein
MGFSWLECRGNGGFGDLAHALAYLRCRTSQTLGCQALLVRVARDIIVDVARRVPCGSGPPGGRVAKAGFDFATCSADQSVFEIGPWQGAGDQSANHKSYAGNEERILFNRFHEGPACAIGKLD